MKITFQTILVLVIFLSACQTSSTPEVLQDCFLYFHLYAWEDLNADGLQNEGEIPLAKVEFVVEGLYAYSPSRGRGTTDTNGEITIELWFPGECSGEFTIKAKSPDDYLPSENTEITVKYDQIADDYTFGFYPAFADCGFAFPFFIWNDTNRNTIQDENESPLQDVEVIIQQISGQIAIGSGASKEDGYGEALAFNIDCADPISLFELLVIPPEGYEITTENPIQIKEGFDGETPFPFGLIPSE